MSMQTAIGAKQKRGKNRWKPARLQVACAFGTFDGGGSLPL